MLARGARDTVELEEGAGREVGRGDVGDRLAGAIRDRDDVRRGRQHRQTRERRARSSGTPALGEFRRRAPRARLRRPAGSDVVERGRDRLDAFAIVLDHFGEPLREVDVAQEPDDAVEQQILDRGVEFELELPGDLVVERIDLGVERDHVVAVAHDEERRRDGGGAAPVWSAMRTTSDGPPRLIIELASCVAMISRRSRCCSSASG